MNVKKKTPNTQRRIIRWIGEDRVKEDAPTYGAARQKGLTSNAQVDALPNTRAANHLAGQILRSGTSPYGNHGGVEAAESRKDFGHKLKVCLKELKETRRWLRLVKKSKMLSEKTMLLILAESEELVRIFFASVRTAEKSSK